MTLQNLFYLTSITTFCLAILLLASLVVLVFFIMKKVGQLVDNINAKVDAVGRVVEDPTDVAMEIGSSILRAGFIRVKRVFNQNSDK